METNSRFYYIVYVVTPSAGLQKKLVSDEKRYLNRILNMTIPLSFALESVVKSKIPKMRLKFVMWQYVEEYATGPHHNSCCRGLAFK